MLRASFLQAPLSLLLFVLTSSFSRLDITEICGAADVIDHPSPPFLPLLVHSDFPPGR